MPYIQWMDKTIYVLYKCSKCGMYVAKTLSLRKEVSYQTVSGRNQASADLQNRLDSDIRHLKKNIPSNNEAHIASARRPESYFQVQHSL